MEDFEYLSQYEDSSYRQRLDTEWTLLNAIREMLGVALKGEITPTYAQSIAIGKSIAPQIFDTEASLLGKSKEPALAREYRQRAEASSQLEGESINPLQLIDEDIEYYGRLLTTSGERDLIQRKLDAIRDVRILFTNKKYTENQLILRDYRVERQLIDSLPSVPIEGDTYREYQISKGRGMRIRLLHPDPPEHSLGADLIYEQYWDKKKLGRLTVVQYKIWNGRVLYFSQAGNLEKQLLKLRNAFCDRELCKPFEGGSRENSYRLPYCVAFLRPTDQLQSPDSRLISSGLHVPICTILRILERQQNERGKKLDSANFRSEALSHKVFEELFNANMLGSRWLSYEEIENLYRQHKILQPYERIVLHAQEFGID